MESFEVDSKILKSLLWARIHSISVQSLKITLSESRSSKESEKC